MKNKEKNFYLFNAIIATICLLASRHYSGQFQGFLHSYGAGTAVPFGVYFLFKIFLPPNTKKYMCALYVLVLTFASEIAQGIGWYAGTYDPKDFIAYISGTSIALFVDVVFCRISR